MDIDNIGLLTNFLDVYSYRVSSQYGSAAGRGGVLNWKNTPWRCVNILGWFLLGISFLMQFCAAYLNEGKLQREIR